MKRMLTFLFLCYCVPGISLFAEETVTLDPMVVESRPMGFWDFVLKFHYSDKEALDKKVRIREYEVMTVLKDGTADKYGLQTGDKILEINGRNDWFRTEIVHFLRYGSVGDKVPLRVLKPNGKEEVIQIELFDHPLTEKVILKLNGVEIHYPWELKVIPTKGKMDIYYLSQLRREADGKISFKPFMGTRLSNTKWFKTLEDDKNHKNKKNRFIEFDHELNYKIVKK